MNPGKFIATVLFMVGLALFNALPYFAGILHAVAVICAIGSDDDDDEGEPRRRKPLPN